MSQLSLSKKFVATCAAATLCTVSLATAASASPQQSPDVDADESYSLLTEEGLDPKTFDEAIQSGALPLSLTSGVEPVEEIDTTVNEDGSTYEKKILYFEDGSYSTTKVEVAQAVNNSLTNQNLRSVDNPVSGCVSRMVGSWDVRTGCNVSWESGPFSIYFNADIQVMSGLAGAGRIDYVGNMNYLAAGGNESNDSLNILVAEGNPARAVAGFNYSAIADLGSGRVSIALEVSNTGAAVVVAG